MPVLSPTLIAVLTGLISGMLLSIPVGPINLTIINEGARRGFRWAALIGLGATVMEVVYCSLAFTGFASFFSKGVVKSGMELFSFAFLLYLGLKFTQTRTIPHTTKIEQHIKEKLDPHSAFMIGFVRVLCNPGVFVFWLILAANFLSREWVRPTWPGKAACVGGVAAGCALWFLTLSYAVSLGHRKLSEKTLLRMEHLSGVCLLIFALLHGINIHYQMTRRKPPPPKPNASFVPARLETAPVPETVTRDNRIPIGPAKRRSPGGSALTVYKGVDTRVWNRSFTIRAGVRRSAGPPAPCSTTSSNPKTWPL